MSKKADPSSRGAEPSVWQLWKPRLFFKIARLARI